MTAQTRIQAAAVQAPLYFLRPMEGRPVSYQYDPPPGIPQRTGIYDPHAVTVRNARPLAPGLSLDVQGFALLRAPSGFAGFQDDEAICFAYYPEVERLLADATGAALVINFDHNVRNAARAARGEAGIRGPVGNTHNDFTARSGPDRARRELEARSLDAAILLRRRFAIVNLWRPICRPVEKSPLAFCDARTIAADDLVTADLVYRDRIGETYAVRYNPAQHWHYFPRLATDEAILIKGYESDPRAARCAPHAAFDDPTSPPDAPSVRASKPALWSSTERGGKRAAPFQARPSGAGGEKPAKLGSGQPPFLGDVELDDLSVVDRHMDRAELDPVELELKQFQQVIRPGLGPERSHRSSIGHQQSPWEACVAD